MVAFFFYKHLTTDTMISKIGESFEMCDGYVTVHKYDGVRNILEIDRDASNNNIRLNGKIVSFNMPLRDVINGINEIRECRFENKSTYTLDSVLAHRTGRGVCQAYIVY